MNPRLITWLQRIFWIFGWSILTLTAVAIATQAYEYFRPVSPIEIPWPKEQFSFLMQVQTLFSSLAQAFFAFLVSSVFDMIFHRKPAKPKQTESFLLLTCLGFVGSGVVGLIWWIQSAFTLLPGFDTSSGLGLLSIFNYFLGLFPSLMAFVYAITVYVLFKHFSQLVAFESEVI